MIKNTAASERPTQQPQAPPPRRSQGADLAELLQGVNYDPQQRGARYRGPPLSDTSQDIDLTALLQVPLPDDDVLDLDALTQSLCSLPLSELLGIAPEYLRAAGIQDKGDRATKSTVQQHTPVRAQAAAPVAPPPMPTPSPDDAELDALLAGVPVTSVQHQDSVATATNAAEVEEWLDSL